MGMLSELREKFSKGELRRSKGDGMLYLSARLHDANAESRDYLKRLAATEAAALDIIRRFDGDGTLVEEFKSETEKHLRHMP